MRGSLGAALVVAVALTASACGNSHARSSRPSASGMVSSNRLIAGGAVRCTVTSATPTVPVGRQLGLVFRFHNVSTRTAKVPFRPGTPWVLIRDSDRKTYDSRDSEDVRIGPDLVNWRVGPTGWNAPIRPGATMTMRVPIPIRWHGPLRITPGCLTSALPALPVDVASPGRPATPGRAISEVVTAAGHLLDHCRPRASGVAVVGRIDPPSGNAPPMHARCSVTLRRERGFYLAQVLVVTPPNFDGVHVVQQPYEEISFPNGVSDSTRYIEAIAWEFVVTRRGATSVDSASAGWTKKGEGGSVPEGVWTRAGWRRATDQSPCGFGFSGRAGEFGASGPYVLFVSVCGR